MGLMDDLMNNAPAIAGQLAKNPQLVNAALSLLSSRDASVGGTAGLTGRVSAFQQKGLGDMVSAWVSKGPNPPVSASQLRDVLGPAVLAQFAQKAGLSASDAGGALAAVLPALVDHLTPEGQVPQSTRSKTRSARCSVVWVARTQRGLIAHCNDAARASATLEPGGTGNVGNHSSATTAADGLGLISYYDDTNGALKVVHCADQACSSR